jgi:alpha-glucoside transport system substrate-binding protein
MRKIVSLFVIGLFVVGVAAFAADKVVNVMHGWPGEQAPVFDKIIEAFEAQNPDIDVQVEIVGRDRPAILATRLAAGNPPDLTPHPWIGLMKEWAMAGQIVDLKGLVDTSNVNPALVPIGEYNDGLYGLFIFPNVKSLIWYNPKVFADKSYELPNTWYELLALCEQMMNDGVAPLSIGLESGAASGWPGTDWIEDIMLRTAGAEVYDKWVAHEIPWTDSRVRKAFEIFGNLFKDGYVLGGKISALTTNFGDAADALFTTPPTAYMHKQATFISGFINDHFEGLVAGEDYNVFVLPTINPQATADGSVPLLVSGDVVTVFNNRPEVIKFAEFLTSETAANIWSSELGELSAYVGASAEDFDNPITRKAQEMLLNASVSRYDGSDLMPGAIGAGAFWSGVLDYISGVSLDTVLENIEAAAQDAY